MSTALFPLVTNQIAFTDEELEELPPQEDPVTRLQRKLGGVLESIATVKTERRNLEDALSTAQGDLKRERRLRIIAERICTLQAQQLIRIRHTRDRRFRRALFCLPAAFAWGLILGHFIHF